MNKGMRKILLTLAVLLFAASIVAIVVMSGKPGPKRTSVPAAISAATPLQTAQPPAQIAPITPITPITPIAATAPTALATKLSARPPGIATTKPASLGSLDPAKDRFRIDFSASSAGIDRIVFSEFWINAEQRIAAIAHVSAVAVGATVIPPLPNESARYFLAPVGTTQDRYTVPLMAARAIEVNGQLVSIFGKVWTETAPGNFESTVVDDAGVVILRLRRSFSIGLQQGDGYDIALTQSVENLSNTPCQVSVILYGPSDLARDANEMMEIRRFQFGYLMSERRDPAQSSVITHDAMRERADVLKSVTAGQFNVWPNELQKEQDQHLSWFGTTSRYFSLAVHATMSPVADGSPSKSMANSVDSIRAVIGAPSATDPAAAPTLFTELHSPRRVIEPGKTADFSMGVYAGPLDRSILTKHEPYSAMQMSGLIIYSMGGCCSWCTFAWLANLMVIFLDFLHDYVVFDWALAIIVLVLVVRLILHPISKKSQVQMQRLTRSMAEMKPEIDALKARYGDDPKRMQQEQMRLYKEKGVNPVGCLGGFLPILLQMPIWMALYAVLYLAFELRQQPAFFGFFQLFNGWSFLSDLSAQDRFIMLSTPINLWIFTLTSINLIPLLMGAVFYVQQKYMAPPPSVQQTPEQVQQQKMMRIMTVVMFPIMLYAAPSGLTLYIMTSTLVGIWESILVRRYIEMTKNDPIVQKKSKTRDAIGRIYEKALARAQESKKTGRKFKDRG